MREYLGIENHRTVVLPNSQLPVVPLMIYNTDVQAYFRTLDGLLSGSKSIASHAHR